MSQLYLRDFCTAGRDWLLDTIGALVRCESPSTDKAAVDRCGVELHARLEAQGGRVTAIERPDRGNHLLARFDARGDAPASREAAQVLILGHFDTVWPVGQLDRMPLRRDGDRLYGPGVFDMKSGIAIAMLAARALVETRTAARPLAMLWTTDEEVGSGTSRATIEDEARRSAAVLVLEPSLPGGVVKTARKGCGEFHLHVRGVAAHAGLDPSRGASAIHELAHQIVRLQQVQDLPRGISVNVGQISGGTRPNVTAEEARAVIDVRVPTFADGVAVDAAVRALRPVNPKTALEVTGGFDRPPLERTAGVARLYNQARAISNELFGRDLGEGGAGGGSDGNFTAALGIPTLDGLGAVGDGAHALHEHVEIGALTDRAALVAALIARL